MSIFGGFTTGYEETDAERKWNLMWDLWAEGEAESPYAELMEYDAEVNNGGHYQYFFNGDCDGELKEKVEKLLAVLPEPLRDNLKRGYDAFASEEDFCDDNDELYTQCDDVFYDQEELVLNMLKTYANTL